MAPSEASIGQFPSDISNMAKKKGSSLVVEKNNFGIGYIDIYGCLLEGNNNPAKITVAHPKRNLSHLASLSFRVRRWFQDVLE